MVTYAISRVRFDGAILAYDTTPRVDSAIYKARRCVFDAAESQGLRDTRAAHEAMAKAESFVRAMGALTFNIGDQRIQIAAIEAA